MKFHCNQCQANAEGDSELVLFGGLSHMAANKHTRAGFAYSGNALTFEKLTVKQLRNFLKEYKLDEMFDVFAMSEDDLQVTRKGEVSL